MPSFPRSMVKVWDMWRLNMCGYEGTSLLEPSVMMISLLWSSIPFTSQLK